MWSFNIYAEWGVYRFQGEGKMQSPPLPDFVKYPVQSLKKKVGNREKSGKVEKELRKKRGGESMKLFFPKIFRPFWNWGRDKTTSPPPSLISEYAQVYSNRYFRRFWIDGTSFIFESGSNLLEKIWIRALRKIRSPTYSDSKLVYACTGIFKSNVWIVVKVKK